jgi:CubicO group peptidase (beta-lactamase class C family)
LSDPLYAYLPAFKDMQVLTNAAGDTVPAKRLITVRDLFIHTAGLGYGLGPSNLLPEQMYQQNYWMPILSNPALTLRELFDGVAKLPLVSQPGAAWIYSVGIDVIGLLVQVISGMPFPAYLKRNLFEPLGMIDTDFHAPPDKLDRLATAYGPKNLKWPMSQATAADLAVGIGPVDVIRTNGSFTEPTGVPSGGGGLISSTHDYYRFAQMLLNRGELDGVRLLGRKTVEMMFANHLPDGVYIADDHANGFGLGGSVLLDVAKSQILGSVGTWSWGGAANTEFWIDPREDLIGLIMMQYMPTDVLPVNADFRNLAYQALVD